MVGAVKNDALDGCYLLLFGCGKMFHVACTYIGSMWSCMRDAVPEAEGVHIYALILDLLWASFK